MEFEKLFFLIHSLTREEKRRISMAVSGRKRTQMLKLYDRILSIPSPNGIHEATVRGEEFKNSSKYYSYRMELARFLITQLLFFESGMVNTVSFIRRAILVDARGLAKKTLHNELVAAYRDENFPSLIRLLELVR